MAQRPNRLMKIVAAAVLALPVLGAAGACVNWLYGVWQDWDQKDDPKAIALSIDADGRALGSTMVLPLCRYAHGMNNFLDAHHFESLSDEERKATLFALKSDMLRTNTALDELTVAAQKSLLGNVTPEANSARWVLAQIRLTIQFLEQAEDSADQALEPGISEQQRKRAVFNSIAIAAAAGSRLNLILPPGTAITCPATRVALELADELENVSVKAEIILANGLQGDNISTAADFDSGRDTVGPDEAATSESSSLRVQAPADPARFALHGLFGIPYEQQ